MEYTITNNNLKLLESYKISKKNFSEEIDKIRKKESGYDVLKRGTPQMCLEWAVHNACYACRIKRESTKDVDLNYPQGFIERAAYAVFGCIVWLFIK